MQKKIPCIGNMNNDEILDKMERRTTFLLRIRQLTFSEKYRGNCVQRIGHLRDLLKVKGTAESSE